MYSRNRTIIRLCSYLSLIPILAFSMATASAQVCSNGSTTDCNPAGSTLNPAAAFVDPTPPAGYVQCAGFINTTGDDVRWDWENNCAGLVVDGGGLFLRLFDDASGNVIAGSRLYAGVPLSYALSTGFNFRTDLHEGEGFLDNPDLNPSQPGTSLAFHETNTSYCSCNRQPSGSGTCNDIYAANTANDKIFYVGGNSSNHAYEAVFGPPGGKGTCNLTDEIVAVRVAIYAGESTLEDAPARFQVTKTFEDGSTGEVDVRLTCNAGLPLEQEFTIAGGDAGVTFTVTDFQPGAMNCEVTETSGPDGYTPVYNNGQGCEWTAIQPAIYSCEITNLADPATFTVMTTLEVNGSDDVSDIEVTITCDSAISEANGGLTLSSLMGDADTLVATVDTSSGEPVCSAAVTSMVSGLETTDDCDNRSISVGGSSSCTIVYTVFFEGIPSLNRHGLAVLILLMLGAGAIGFRRFA